MQDSTILLVDLSLQLFGAVVLLAVLLGTLRMTHKAEKWNHYVQYMIVSAIVYLCMNALRNLLTLNEHPDIAPLSLICSIMVTVAYHMTFCMFVAFLTVYIRQYYNDVTIVPLLISNVVFVIAVSLRIGSLMGTLPESVDWFMIGRSCGHIILLLTIYLMLKYRKYFETTREWLVLFIIPSVPVLASILKHFDFPSYLLPLGGVLSILFVSNFLHNTQELRMRKQEDELITMKAQLMVSQIGPHFTFNVLNAIYVLCETDPAKAQSMIDSFSQYLRQNIDSLTSMDLVPFSKELYLVKNYVYLEQMRFGDDLKVIYDLRCKNFELPPLTVQPLIENAIKHGVMKRHDGGTVTLRTEESKNNYYITVEDDGVGFSKEELRHPSEKPGRDHAPVGLRNVKYRLKVLCHGELTVDSEPGVGTKVQILIPKREEALE